MKNFLTDIAGREISIHGIGYRVKNLLVRKKDARVVQVLFGTRGFFSQKHYVSVDDIEEKGRHWSVTEEENTSRQPDTVFLVGMRVRTEEGVYLGRIWDVHVYDDSWEISHVLIRDKSLLHKERSYLVSRKHILDITDKYVVVRDMMVQASQSAWLELSSLISRGEGFMDKGVVNMTGNTKEL